MMSGVRLKKRLGCNAMASAGPSISKHIWLQNHLLNQQFSEACLTSSGLVFGSTFNFINKQAEVGNVGAFIVYHLISILRTQHLSVTRFFLCNQKICGALKKQKMHFLPADEESEFGIYAIRSSCFMLLCSQNQVLETELLGHIIAYKDVPHWDPEQQQPLNFQSLGISKRQRASALSHHSCIQNILQEEPVVAKPMPRRAGR